MKYYFYLSFLLLALACEKTDPAPIPFPIDPTPIDTAYGYPPRVVYNCLGSDTIGFEYPTDIPGWKKTLILTDSNAQAFGIPYFTDEMNGFRFRYGGIIYKTTNGGQTWKEVYNQPPTYFLHYSFSSPEHGVIACTDDYSNVAVYFLVTYDGGNTWVRSTSTASNFNFVGKIQFLAPNLGYLSATNDPFGPTIRLYQTIDSAKTWAPSQGTGQGFNGEFFFQNRDTGYLSSNPYQLFRSIDGGLKWASTELPIYSLTNILFFDASYGQVYGSGGVAITQSGGNRWAYVSQRPTHFGHFFDDGSAVLFQSIKYCYSNTTEFFQAFVTTDDFGATWKVGRMTKSFVTGNHFCFINERCIIGLVDDGKLYKWTKL